MGSCGVGWCFRALSDAQDSARNVDISKMTAARYEMLCKLLQAWRVCVCVGVRVAERGRGERVIRRGTEARESSGHSNDRRNKTHRAVLD